MANAIDPTFYLLVAYALPLLAGFFVTLLVLTRIRRTFLVIIATAILLWLLFGLVSLAGAVIGVLVWISIGRGRWARRPHYKPHSANISARHK